MKALIMIAHGSRKESSNTEFLKMAEDIKKEKNNYDFIEASFLELAIPDIKSTVSKLLLKEIKTIDFYPFFLNSGKHVLVDIPNIVEELKTEYPQIKFDLLNHFGKSENVKKIILNDIS